jgi:ABC-type amino acid transport substrate-binding protein
MSNNNIKLVTLKIRNKMKYLFSLLSLFISLAVLSQEETLASKYTFASIDNLIEQDIARIVLPQIYQNLGIDIDIVPLPAKRAQFEANVGTKDGEILRIWTYGEENKKSIRVPTPYYYLETMPFIRKDSNINILEREDLENYRLAKVRGVKHTNNITVGFLEVYDMNSTENMFKMLHRGVVDVVLTNTLDGNLVLKKLGYKNIVASDKPLAVLPLYHYIYEKNGALVPLIDAEILKLKNNGKLAELILLAEQEVIKKNH